MINTGRPPFRWTQKSFLALKRRHPSSPQVKFHMVTVIALIKKVLSAVLKEMCGRIIVSIATEVIGVNAHTFLLGQCHGIMT